MNKYKKGDLVVVITGKDKGKSGRIILVDSENQKLSVEGVNEVVRHKKPTQDNPGGRIKENGYIHSSNVLHVCPKTKKPTRIAIKQMNNKNERVSVSSGERID